jgi:hypothetical protein
MSDDEHVPPAFRDQIGRKYRSRQNGPYVRRRPIVIEYIRSLALKGEVVTTEKIRRMLEALERGYALNSKAISKDLTLLREHKRIQPYPNGHRIRVDDAEGSREYPSLRWAAAAEGCSKEAARKWLMKPGQPNRRGQVWSYIDSADERPKTNRR